MRVRWQCCPMLLATMLLAWTGRISAATAGDSNAFVGSQTADATVRTASVILAWAEKVGVGGSQGAADVYQLGDGSFNAAGYTKSFGAGDADLWTVRLDSAGTPVSQRAYGGTGLDLITQLRPTADGGSILVGLTTSFGPALLDPLGQAPLIVKLDGGGNIQWQNTYSASGREWANSVRQTSDGGFIVAGGTDPAPFGGNDEQATLLKLDATGKIVWQQTFATAGGLMSDALETSGGFIAVAPAFSGAGPQDILVLKLDASGLIVWQKTYGGTGNDTPSAIQLTSDGYIVAGSTTSFGAGGMDAWLLKLNFDGSVAWQRTYGGAGDDSASSVQLTSDGFIVGGATVSFGSTGTDAWVFNLDGVGNVLWQRRYDSGGTQDDARAVRPTTDGGYIVASYAPAGAPGPDNFFVLKLMPDGSISSQCPAGVGAEIFNASVAKTTVSPVDSVVGTATFTATASATALTLTDTNAQVNTVCGNACGDGVLESGEQCDDGNNRDGDCCSAACRFESFGSSCADDGNPCTNEQCNGAGTCAHPDNTDNCDDGDACTTGDACSAGVCVGPARNCNDGDPCTDDACISRAGCVHPVNTGPCDDANPCTTGDTCSSGQCIGGPPPSCDDGNPCTVDSCSAFIGCVRAPVSCSDGNPCTDDACDPASGCVFTNNTGTCEGDGNLCTAEQCDGSGHCGFASNRAPGTSCDDGRFCNGTDSCDDAGQCVGSGDPCPGTACNTCQEAGPSCFDPAGAQCNDDDSGTVRDACNGAGVCAGQAVTGNYALLRWPPPLSGELGTVLGWAARIEGDVCSDVLRARRSSQINGDAIVPKMNGTAMAFSLANQVTHNLITAGGKILGRSHVTVGGRIDTVGTAPELGECTAGASRASARRDLFAQLPVSSGFAVGTIVVQPRGVRRIPSSGMLGAGRTVIDTNAIRLARSARVRLVGGPDTDQVIVRVKGSMKLFINSAIELEGLAPEKVLFLVDGPATLLRSARVGGTVFATGRLFCGWSTSIDGALLSDRRISVLRSSVVNLHPFAGW